MRTAVGLADAPPLPAPAERVRRRREISRTFSDTQSTAQPRELRHRFVRYLKYREVRLLARRGQASTSTPSSDSADGRPYTLRQRAPSLGLSARVRFSGRATLGAGGSAIASPSRQNADFRLLLAGSSVSMLGSRITAVAYPLLVLAVTGSPLAAGWSTFAAIAPSALIYLPAGALVDRWDPRRVMFASELGRGAAISSIVAAIALAKLNLFLLIGAAATEQTLGVFSTLAERRFARSLVAQDRATSALVLSETRTHLVVLLGRPIGALMFGVAWVFPFAADACTFVVAMVTLFYIRNGRSDECMTFNHMIYEFRRRLYLVLARVVSVTSNAYGRIVCIKVPDGDDNAPGKSRNLDHILGEIHEGFRWLGANPFAWLGVTLTTGTTFVGQAMIMIFFAEAHSQHLPSVRVGIVLAASGAGGVIGSVIASRLFPLVGYPLLQIQMLVWSVTFGALAFGWESYRDIAVAMAALGLTGALGNIAIDNFIVRHAGATLARVMSVDRLTSLSALAFGPAFGGALFANFGARSAVTVLFSVTVALVVGTSLTVLVSYLRHNLATAKHGIEPVDSNDDIGLGEVGIPIVDFDKAHSAVIGEAAPGSKAASFNLVAPTILGPAFLLSRQELQEARESQAKSTDLAVP
ncbi:MAG TPA: MFS transporter [Streptosporangiaceae bacterium]|nr:MFS transporter [Streptosporangiaceae bacterium]